MSRPPVSHVAATGDQRGGVGAPVLVSESPPSRSAAAPRPRRGYGGSSAGTRGSGEAERASFLQVRERECNTVRWSKRETKATFTYLLL